MAEERKKKKSRQFLGDTPAEPALGDKKKKICTKFIVKAKKEMERETKPCADFISLWGGKGLKREKKKKGGSCICQSSPSKGVPTMNKWQSQITRGVSLCTDPL